MSLKSYLVWALVFTALILWIYDQQNQECPCIEGYERLEEGPGNYLCHNQTGTDNYVVIENVPKKQR